MGIVLLNRDGAASVPVKYKFKAERDYASRRCIYISIAQPGGLVYIFLQTKDQGLDNRNRCDIMCALTENGGEEAVCAQPLR